MYNTLSAFSSLLKKENIFDLDLFIKDYQTFEEIPLVSRRDRLCHLRDMFPPEEVQFFLVNCAVFILNNIAQHARKRLEATEISNFFVCLTFFDSDDIEAMGYAVPSFLVTRKSALFDFLRKKDEIALESLSSVLGNAFLSVGVGKAFKFVKSITPDAGGELCRIYAIPLAAVGSDWVKVPTGDG